MAIALTLLKYLEAHDVPYEVVKHTPTPSASRTAQASHVPGGSLAKGVVLKQADDYLLAVLPASSRVELDVIERWLDRPVSLAPESEFRDLFPDCDVGAVPAVGDAYGLEAVVDSSLDEQSDVYFEGGDHRTVLRIAGAQFRRLTGGAPRARFSALL